MADARDDTAYQIIWEVRRLFRSLAARADSYLAASGLTAADRAVMEFLYPDSELTVPDIARRYEVTRQHVQATVNRLQAQGLLGSVDNPMHKRSRLIRLSATGRRCFEGIRRREAGLVRELFGDVPDDELAITLATLQSIQEKL